MFSIRVFDKGFRFSLSRSFFFSRRWTITAQNPKTTRLWELWHLKWSFLWVQTSFFWIEEIKPNVVWRTSQLFEPKTARLNFFELSNTNDLPGVAREPSLTSNNVVRYQWKSEKEKTQKNRTGIRGRGFNFFRGDAGTDSQQSDSNRQYYCLG